MTKKSVAVLLAAVCVVTGLGGGLYFLSTHPVSSGAQGRWADGPTLYQAIDQVNVTVRNLSGGPWKLFSYVGFAPEGPFSPAAFPYSNSTNLTLKDCQPQFDGLTVWNGSFFPVFNGNLASGTATFWQFSFLSTSTQEVLVATDVLGVAHVYSPLPFTNSCISQSSMAADASYYVSWVNPLPVDTSVQAASAYNASGKAFETAHSPLVEVFANGWPPLNNFNHGPGGGASYLRCGLVGAAGLQPEGVVGEWPNGTVQSTFNGSLSCTAVRQPGPPVVYQPYAVVFSVPATNTSIGAGSTGESFPIRVEFPDWYNTTPYYDGWGLMSWMTQLALQNATGHMLPSTWLSCQNWTPSLADCHPAATGWSAVLLSPAGRWMDTFPSATNTSAWAIPNVPLIGGERMVIVYPSWWIVSTDYLIIDGAASIPTVAGSVSL